MVAYDEIGIICTFNLNVNVDTLNLNDINKINIKLELGIIEKISKMSERIIYCNAAYCDRQLRTERWF